MARSLPPMGRCLRCPWPEVPSFRSGVVIAFNSGKVVDLVTRVFEHELTANVGSAMEYFAQLRGKRRISSLVSHAIMLFGERNLLSRSAG